MASNVTFQSRNVLSKKLMVKKEVAELQFLNFLGYKAINYSLRSKYKTFWLF
jgi:hypothetical protein